MRQRDAHGLSLSVVHRALQTGCRLYFFLSFSFPVFSLNIPPFYVGKQEFTVLTKRRWHGTPRRCSRLRFHRRVCTMVKKRCFRTPGEIITVLKLEPRCAEFFIPFVFRFRERHVIIINVWMPARRCIDNIRFLF